MPLIGLGVGAGVGVLKNKLDAPQRQKERVLAAQTAAYSPWTHMQAQTPASDPSALSAAVQGGMGGAAFGQQFGAPKPPVPGMGGMGGY